MDIEVKRMSPTAIEMLDQLSIVCKRFGVDYYAASQNQRDRSKRQCIGGPADQTEVMTWGK